MKIDREKVKNAFASYTAHYDCTDEKVKLKIDHTYRVAKLCDRIAKSEHVTIDEQEIAWLCGMLHDVGRFEQVRRYGTFSDADSIDHALLGTQILFDEGKITDYVEDVSKEECDFLRSVIGCHSAYRIPTDFDERTAKFAHILRDADKIDILKVNIEVPIEEIYNVTTEELKNAEVSPEVMESFAKRQATLRSLQKTPVDHIVGHISLVFELVYKESIREVIEQGYLAKLLHFQSNCPQTMEQFQILGNRMETYLQKKGFCVSFS